MLKHLNLVVIPCTKFIVPNSGMKHITFEGDLKGDLGSGAHDSSGIFAIQLGAKAPARP